MFGNWYLLVPVLLPLLSGHPRQREAGISG